MSLSTWNKLFTAHLIIFRTFNNPIVELLEIIDYYYIFEM